MRLVAIFRPAIDALRDRRGTALLLAASVALGVAVLWPMATLTRPDLRTRLSLPALHAATPPLDLGADARPLSALQQDTLETLFRVATVLAGLTLLSVLITIIGLSGARRAMRAPEIAVRRAVGASRRLLLAAALVELIALGGLAYLSGAGAGISATTLARHSWGAPFLSGPTLLPAALLLVALVFLLSGTAFVGGEPARRVAEVSARPLPVILPAVHFALALITVTTGALLLRRGAEVDAVETRTTGSFVALSFDGSNAERAVKTALLIDTLRGDAFDTVGLTSPGAIVGLGTVGQATTDCGICYLGFIETRFRYVLATHLVVSPDTFDQLGIHLRQGRLLERSDDWNAEPVAVINYALAGRHFQNGEAVGRRIKIGADETWHTVIGVVDDPIATGFGAGERPPFTIYLSALQHPPAATELLVRGPHPDSGRALGRALRLTAGSRSTVQDAGAVAAAESRPLRWFGAIFALYGAAILLLGLGGTALQMLLWVRSLRTELGVRRAAGATRRRLIGYLGGQALRVAGIGLFLGLWFAPGLWFALGELLPGLADWDPRTVMVTAAITAVVTVAAALIPGVFALRQTPAALLAVEN